MSVDRALAQRQVGARCACWSCRRRSAEAPEARGSSARADGACRLRARRASSRARSGAAPSCWNTVLAAPNSSPAVSSSPSERHANPMSIRTRAAAYGASSCCHISNARRRGSSAARASPAASSTAPRACAAIARRTSVSMCLARVPPTRTGTARVLDVAPGQHDFDVGGQQLRALQRVGRRVHDAADCGAGCVGRPWAIRSSASPGCGSHPSRLALRYASSAFAKFPRKPKYLGLLIERRGRRFPVGLLGTLAGATCFRHGVGPGPLELQDFCPSTRHVPVNASISGCCSHHLEKATVHSRARLNAYTCWQASITLQ